MSIKLIARDLYQAGRRVDDLEKELARAPLSETESLKDKLRRAKAERDRLRRILAGQIGR